MPPINTSAGQADRGLFTRRAFALLCASPLAAQTAETEVELDWHDARKLTVEGFGFRDVASPYDRLPARAENVVRRAVWDLSRHSAGGVVRFSANTPTLRARWTLTGKSLSGPNMTPIAASGLDLYTMVQPGSWRWLGVGRPTKLPENTDTLVSGIPKGERQYMLYLPLYNGVTSVEIGVPKGTVITPAAPRPSARKPIVFYGTFHHARRFRIAPRHDACRDPRPPPRP